MNMVFLYYDNPLMLSRQIECWNSYIGVLKPLPEILLVDDGSPTISAADVVRHCGCKIPLKVFRIKEDIPWNFAGARNLACLQSTGWIYMSDIDTLLFAEEAKRFFQSRTLDKNSFYIPKRVWLPGLQEAEPAIVNLLFHKEKYLEIGGYDEDYAGHYGREETDYFNRLKRVAKKVFREDILIGLVPRTIIEDANTITDRPRDKTRNAALFERKQAANFPKPINPLRFTWARVL